MSKQVGYASVSTVDQTTNQQHDALKAAGCEVIFEDVISGASTERAGLDACLAALEPGDTLVCVALDRLGRSMAHLLSTVESLAARGVGFRLLREGIQTDTAAGKLVLGIFASLAEFERSLIRERTVSALTAKKARGEKLGRPNAMTPSQVRAAQRMIDDGEGASHVARLFKVDRATLYRALKKAA